jgi:hypothetical protein
MAKGQKRSGREPKKPKQDKKLQPRPTTPHEVIEVEAVKQGHRAK